MKRKLGILALVSVALSSSLLCPPATAAEPDLAAQLAESARKAGVPIDTEETVTATAPGLRIAATSVQGFEHAPATDLAKGSDMGYLFIDAPGSGLATGGYLLRASADASDIRLGEFPAKVELVDAQGKVVQTLESRVDAWSLTVPETLAYPRTRVGIEVHQETDPSGPGEARIIRVDVYYDCPNGELVYIGSFYIDVDVPWCWPWC
jgi:hypothetical protein